MHHNTTRDVILFSGGHESSLCAWLAFKQRTSFALCFIEYGQPYLQQERDACHYVSSTLNIPLIVRHAPNMECVNGNFLNRNETLLRIAAEAGNGALWFGCRGVLQCLDTYGDTNRQFVNRMERSLQRRILTPLLLWPKPLIKRCLRRSVLRLDRLFSSHGFVYSDPAPLLHRRGNSTNP